MTAATEKDLCRLKRLKAHGVPVMHTKMGFELQGGEYLCRLADMRQLTTLGLVSRTDSGHYWLTPAGELLVGKGIPASPVKPTCRNTLLSLHLATKGHTQQTFFQKLVIPTGYPFFEWNERIYQVQDDVYIDTGLVLSSFIHD